MAGTASRMLLLMGFPLLVLASQVVWVTYSPVASHAAGDMGVSKEAMGFLVMLFPILYILIAYPAGRLLDTRFRLSLYAASLAFIATGIVRLLAPADYTPILAAQVVAAAAQPIVVNGITPYSSVYYEEDKRPIAVSLGSAFMYLGMIAAMALGAPIYYRYGVTGLSYYSGLLSIATGVWTIAMVERVEPLAMEVERVHIPTLESVKLIVKRREVWVFAGIIGLGLAILDIIMTWIEPVLSLVDLDAIAGNSTALMITAGVIGASLLPTVSARRSVRKKMLMTAAGVGALSFLLIAAFPSASTVYTMLGATGFLLMAGLPIIFEWIEKTTPVNQQGETIGVIMLTGHIIAVIGLAASTPVINSFIGFFGLLAALAVAAFALASMLPRG